MHNYVSQGDGIDDSELENDSGTENADGTAGPNIVHHKVVWQPALKAAFVAAFSESKMDALDGMLGAVETADPEVTQQNQIEAISCLANEIFLTSSQEAGMTRTFGSKANRPRKKAEHKPWFNQECTDRRKDYLRCKRKVKKHKAQESIQQLDAIAKDYKRFIRQTSRRYYKRIHV
jgi:hypothetical protein